MSTDTRNFLNALFDHWPITIFLPGIILMLVIFIVTTMIWDRHDEGVAEAAAPPRPPVAPSPVLGDPNARTEALPANGGRPVNGARPTNGVHQPQRVPGKP